MKRHKPLQLLALSASSGAGTALAVTRLGSSEVVTLPGASELVARALESPPDGVVLEAGDDHELVRRLREVSAWTPILLLDEVDGSASPGDTDRLLSEAIELDSRLQIQRLDSDRILRTVSHDLRAPLVKMAMFCDLLLRRFAGSLPAEDVARFDRFRHAQNALAGELGEVVLELRRRPGRDYALGNAEKRAEAVAIEADLQHLVHVVPTLLRGRLDASKALFGELEARHRGRIEAKADEYLDIIARSSRVLDRYAETFGLFERLHDERSPLERVELEDVVRDVARERETAFRAAGGRVVVGSLPAVLGRRDWLGRAFGELLDNARRHQPGDRAPRVEISATPIGNGRVSVRVEDDGVGFAAGSEREVFAPFFVPGPSEDGALGVGLSICRGIVTLHGGDIEAEAGRSRGAAIEFDLALAAN